MTTALNLIRGDNARRHRLVAAERIKDNAPFVASSGNLRGEPHRPHVTPVFHDNADGSRTPVRSTRDYGYLPRCFVPDVDAADYIVWSYGTILAWRTPEHPTGQQIWTIPRVFYSNTTTKHTGALLSVLYQLPDSPVILRPSPSPTLEGTPS